MIVVSLAVGFGAAVAANTCTAWQALDSSICVQYGYAFVAFPALLLAGILFLLGILRLVWAPQVPESPERLYCTNCGHALIGRPETNQWYCERCGRTYRSGLEPAFFPRDEGRYL